VGVERPQVGLLGPRRWSQALARAGVLLEDQLMGAILSPLGPVVSPQHHRLLSDLLFPLVALLFLVARAPLVRVSSRRRLGACNHRR
jgi:hypothetical protein